MMTFWKKLADSIFSKERRKSDRLSAPELSAFFWTGGAPIQHGIRDISATGLYLLTEERWYPGTVVVITLQKVDEAEGTPERSVAVQSKAVRWGEDGVGLEFVLQQSMVSNRGHNMLEAGVDRKSLERFLKGLNSDNGYATVHRVVPPSDSMEEVSSTKTSPGVELGERDEFRCEGAMARRLEERWV